jgi:hypothetical protein
MNSGIIPSVATNEEKVSPNLPFSIFVASTLKIFAGFLPSSPQ